MQKPFHAGSINKGKRQQSGNQNNAKAIPRFYLNFKKPINKKKTKKSDRKKKISGNNKIMQKPFHASI